MLKQKKKIVEAVAIFTLAILFLLAPLNPNGVVSSFQAARASDEINGNIVWSTDHTISGELLITRGSMLSVKKGVTITFNDGYIRSDRGFLSVEGTVKEPVKFKNANNPSTEHFYSIILENGSVGLFKNTRFSGGGFTSEGGLVQMDEKGLFNQAFAEDTSEYLGAIDVNDSYLEAQNCTFENNANAITVKNQSWEDGNVSVNRSRFEGNEDFDVRYDNSKEELDFRYNWWGGDPDPEKLSGNINTADHSARENFLDPVIIIPGIMGSWNGEIDPIFHTYDNLWAELAANGYIPEENLFTFPYEWRDSNIDNALKLKQKIDEIKNQSHWPKVDIVAHSMGGLLAREYIENEGDYGNDVDQLITLGTPHLGAPGAYIKWEAGESFWSVFDMIGKRIFQHEAEENGYPDVFHYIRERPMLSVQELLPVYPYLYDVENDYALRDTYSADYPRNKFLEDLNKKDVLWPLEELEFTKIIGRVNEPESTVAGYNVVDADMGEYWEHGYPHGSEIPWIGDEGLRKSDGDGTVPLLSAESVDIPADYSIFLPSEHNALPTDAQQDILEILTGKRPDKKIDEWKIDDILIGLVFSPVDFQIVSPSGERLGKNFETEEEFNEIEGAYYTGFDTETEFLTIPNPEDGEYQILTEGTRMGKYEIEIAKITEDKETSQTITGEARQKIREGAKIEVDGNSVKKVEKLTIPEPEKKSVAADQVRAEIHTKASSSGNNYLSEDSLVIQDGRSNVQKLDALKSDVRRRFDAGEIKKRKESGEIMKKLSHIRVYLKGYTTGMSLKKMKTAKTKANKDITKLILYINKKTPKFITEEARSSLVEDLGDLRI